MDFVICSHKMLLISSGVRKNMNRLLNTCIYGIESALWFSWPVHKFRRDALDTHWHR